MQRRMIAVLLASFSLGTFFGCGNPNGGPAENQGSVDDLSALMISHPELSQASLKEIKDSSSGGSHKGSNENVKFQRRYTIRHSADSLAPKPVATAEGKNSENLNPEIAKEAQALIDDILDKFDFGMFMHASFKLTGIFINEVHEFEKIAEGLDKTYGGSKGFGSNKFGDSDEKGFGKFDKRYHHSVKGFANSGSAYSEESHFESRSETHYKNKKFNDGSDLKSITCESFVSNPWLKLAQEEFERAISINKKQIKASLSGCAEIQGGPFVKCVGDFNQLMELINSHATCAMNSIDDLNKATDGKFDELNRSAFTCMHTEFRKCHFEMTEPAGAAS